VEQPQARLVQAPLFGEDGRLAHVPGEHSRQLYLSRGPIERFGDGRLQQPVAQPDAQLPGEDLDHVLGGQAVAAPEQRAEDRTLGRGSGGGLHRGIGLRHFHDPREWPGSGSSGLYARTSGHGPAQVRGAIVGLAQGTGRRAGELRHGRGDRRPAEADDPLVRLRKGPPGEKDGRRPKLVARELGEISGQQSRLFGGAGRSADALG